MKSIHLWQGEWIDDKALKKRCGRLSGAIDKAVRAPLKQETLLSAADSLAKKLLTRKAAYKKLLKVVMDSKTCSDLEAQQMLDSMGEFLQREKLTLKLKRELGKVEPFTPERVNYKEDVFESWKPLGFIVHVSPTNAFSVGALSVVEGLLAGNINFLKTSAKDSDFPQLFLKYLIDEDKSKTLAQHIFVAKVSSQNRAILEMVFSQADAISAWGGEDAIQGVREYCPPTARFIDWGPKISFAYLSATKFRDASVIKDLASQMCLLEQQACSSPQCVYLETDDKKRINRFAEQLAAELTRVSPKIPYTAPSDEEQAEITVVTEQARLASVLGESKVIEADSKAWRILIEYNSVLKASPLYRTIWVKPLPRKEIVTALRPMRGFLQTVGLACGVDELASLSEALFSAGGLRITPPGSMLESYDGEPHDGVYALQRYCKRISIRGQLSGISSFSELSKQKTIDTNEPLLTKQGFQRQKIERSKSELFFKSGGSSGKPKLSVFTYDDYHSQMEAAARGLYAAGLEPSKDRCINLFFGGGLYGGFLSFFTILEYLKVPQLPMAAVEDLSFVADMIVKNEANVILGMPSYIIQLFDSQKEKLKKYGGVTKVFYGGEHFNEVQKRQLTETFKVKLIKSATYGSVDAGPLGYQCPSCEGSAHHLHTSLQSLEILETSTDKPVKGNEVGRLIFSSHKRQGQKIQRYDIGDLGRWIEGPCKCGREAPRFELMGRHGDICRVGTIFVNYQTICNIISDHLSYAGEVQLRLMATKEGERCVVRMNKHKNSSVDAVQKLLLGKYSDVRNAVLEKVISLDIEYIKNSDFVRTKGSGKLIHIVDDR